MVNLKSSCPVVKLLKIYKETTSETLELSEATV